MRSATIFVPIMPPSTNSIYAGVHWSKRKREADRVHGYVALLVTEKALKPFTQAVHISMRPSLGKGARSRDVSNYSYAYKLIEDALVHAGVILGDESDNVRSMTILAPTVDREAASGLWVTIDECEGGA